jgi:hypothetical protein
MAYQGGVGGFNLPPPKKIPKAVQNQPDFKTVKNYWI